MILAMPILTLIIPVTSIDQFVSLSILVGGPLLVYLLAVQTRVISVVGLFAVGGYLWWVRDLLHGGDGLEAFGLLFFGWIGACSLVVLDLCFVFFPSSSGSTKQHPS